MTHHEKILAIWPHAEHITDVGRCDACKRQGLYFFTLPQHFKIENGRVDGGYYCANCGFSNAGRYPAELVAGLEISDAE